MEVRNIGVLGSGVVGQALANGFIKHGYEVMVGTRSEEKLSEWKLKAGNRAVLHTVVHTRSLAQQVVTRVQAFEEMIWL